MAREDSIRRIAIVVDDSLVAQRVLRRRLEDGGFDVVTLDSPLAIARAVEEHRPHVILMDLEMPGLDGDVAASTLLRGIADPPPIVIHSSIGGETMHARARACGAIGAIEKTNDDAKFMRELSALVTRP